MSIIFGSSKILAISLAGRLISFEVNCSFKLIILFFEKSPIQRPSFSMRVISIAILVEKLFLSFESLEAAVNRFLLITIHHVKDHTSMGHSIIFGNRSSIFISAVSFDILPLGFVEFLVVGVSDLSDEVDKSIGKS